MNKSWQVVLAFIVVFLAGGAIGSVFTLRYVSAHAPAQQPAAVGGGAGARPEDFTPQLMRRWANLPSLRLTSAQREKVRTFILESAEDLNRNQREAWHSGSLIVEHMMDEIASVLNPQQRATFYQLREQQRNKLNRYNQEIQRRAALRRAEAQGEGPNP